MMPVTEENRQGFEYWKVLECTHDYNNSIYYDEENVKHSWQGYDAEIQTDSAISFIERNKGKPFMLFLSWGPPHDPYLTAPEKYRNIYADRKNIKVRPNVRTVWQKLPRNRLQDITRILQHLMNISETAGCRERGRH